MPNKTTSKKSLSRSSVIFLIVFSVFWTIISIIGTDTRDRRPTQPRLSIPDANRDFAPYQKGIPQRTLDLPWEYYENTDLYNEFIEHLDEKGIMEDEPDAIDIWERYFE